MFLYKNDNLQNSYLMKVIYYAKLVLYNNTNAFKFLVIF